MIFGSTPISSVHTCNILFQHTVPTETFKQDFIVLRMSILQSSFVENLLTLPTLITQFAIFNSEQKFATLETNQ